jgi:hypothetical protein
MTAREIVLAAHPRASFAKTARKNSTDKQKGGRRSADRRVSYRPHQADAAARLCPSPSSPSPACGGGSGRGARSPLGAPPRLLLRRSNATAQLRAALPRRWIGLSTLSAAELSQAPGRPVIVPAGTMPKAARARIVTPPAGTALAPSFGNTSGSRPLGERDSGVITEMVTNVKHYVTLTVTGRWNKCRVGRTKRYPS